jgi:hypothetical protein
MTLHRGQCWLIWEDISMWGFIWGVIHKVETLILGTLGNLVSESYRKQFVLWDIDFYSLNFWLNCQENICGISVGDAFRKLSYLGNSKDFNVVGDTVSSLLNFWISYWERICRVVIEGLILCKTKIAHWESLERSDPTIFTEHH